MSLAASQARLIYVTRYMSDLEYGRQLIVQERSELAYQAQQYSDDDDAVEYFHYQDQQLEAELTTLDTQYKVQSAELESVQKMVDDSAKRAGTYA